MAATDTAPTVIRARGLTRRYGELVAVDRLDLDIRAGEIFGLLGPNGAGKTTTILMLLGLSEPTAGSVSVLGLDPRREPLAVKQRVGYLPDSVGFYGDLTGRQNLRYTARLNGLEHRAFDVAIDELLRRVGLVDAADRRVDTYSRGMKQRLGLADVLLKDPEVAILDEPTMAIDPAGVAEILALVRGLADERGVAVLLSSHLLHQVQQVCDRVAIFVAGRVVAQGTMASLAAGLGGGPVIVEVGVEGSTEQAAAVARAVPGVQSAERDERDPALLVVEAGTAGADALLGALVGGGVRVRHFRRRGDELDEIYRRYFRAGEDAGDGRAA